MTIIEICIIIITAFLVITSFIFILLGILGIKFFKKLNKLIHKPAEAVSEISDSVSNVSHKIRHEGEGIVQNLKNIKDSIAGITRSIKNDFQASSATASDFLKSFLNFLKKRKKQNDE